MLLRHESHKLASVTHLYFSSRVSEGFLLLFGDGGVRDRDLDLERDLEAARRPRDLDREERWLRRRSRSLSGEAEARDFVLSRFLGELLQVAGQSCNHASGPAGWSIKLTNFVEQRLQGKREASPE